MYEVDESVFDKEIQFVNFFSSISDRRKILKELTNTELKFILSRGYINHSIMSLFKMIDEAIEYKDVDSIIYYSGRLSVMNEYLMLQDDHDMYICAIVNKIIALFNYNPEMIGQVLSGTIVDLVSYYKGEREYCYMLMNSDPIGEPDKLFDFIPIGDDDCFHMESDDRVVLQMFKLKDLLTSIKHLEKKYSFKLGNPIKKMILDVLTIRNEVLIFDK